MTIIHISRPSGFATNKSLAITSAIDDQPTLPYRRSRKSYSSLELGLPGSMKSKKVRVSAVVKKGMDDSRYTTYEVTLDEDSETEDSHSPATAQLSLSDSELSQYTNITSEGNLVGGGGRAGLGLGIPNDHLQSAGRIILHDETPGNISAAEDHLGADASTDGPVGLGITFHGAVWPTTQSGATIQRSAGNITGFFTAIDDQHEEEGLNEDGDEEQAYYHLPLDLFTPDLQMSTEQFQDTVRKWTARRVAYQARRAWNTSPIL